MNYQKFNKLIYWLEIEKEIITLTTILKKTKVNIKIYEFMFVKLIEYGLEIQPLFL